MSIPITDAMGPVQGTATLTLPSPSSVGNHTQDATWFAHTINGNDQSTKTAAANADQGPSLQNHRLFSAVHMLTERVQEQRQDIARQMFTAATTRNPLDILQTHRLMSEYHLENLLTAKVIGKSTETIEKLTSLQ